MRPAGAVGLPAGAEMKWVREALAASEPAKGLGGRSVLSRVGAISLSPLAAGLPVGPWSLPVLRNGWSQL